MAGVNKSNRYQVMQSLLDRPIAFHRAFVKLGGGAMPALMFSQAFYWTPRTSSEDGWFYKTQDEWQEETGMTRYEQETARKRLLQVVSPSGKHVWHERRAGVPAKLYYRIDLEAVWEILFAEVEGDPDDPAFLNVEKPHTGNGKPLPASLNVEKPHTGMMDHHNQERGSTPFKNDGLAPSITENTAETTTKTSAESTTTTTRTRADRVQGQPGGGALPAAQVSLKFSNVAEAEPEKRVESPIGVCELATPFATDPGVVESRRLRALALEQIGKVAGWNGTRSYISALSDDKVLCLLTWLWFYNGTKQADPYAAFDFQSRYRDYDPLKGIQNVIGFIRRQVGDCEPAQLHPAHLQEMYAAVRAA